MNRPQTCLNGRSNSINEPAPTSKSGSNLLERPRIKVGSRNRPCGAISALEVPSLEASLDLEYIPATPLALQLGSHAQLGGHSRWSSAADAKLAERIGMG